MKECTSSFLEPITLVSPREGGSRTSIERFSMGTWNLNPRRHQSQGGDDHEASRARHFNPFLPYEVSSDLLLSVNEEKLEQYSLKS